MFITRFRAASLAVAMLPALAPAAPLTLEQALELAVQRSEAARSSRAGVLGATEAARAAGQLPDPMLRAGIENLPVTGADRFSTTRDSMTMKRIGIAQEWVSSDKRAARQAAADAMVGREGISLQAIAAEVRVQTALGLSGGLLRRRDAARHHAVGTPRPRGAGGREGAPVVDGRQQPGGAGHDQRARGRAGRVGRGAAAAECRTRRAGTVGGHARRRPCGTGHAADRG